MNWSRILRVGGWAVKSKNTATAQPSTTNTHSTAEHSHLHFHSTMPQPPPYKTVGASSLNMGRALGVGGKDLKGWSKTESTSWGVMVLVILDPSWHGELARRKHKTNPSFPRTTKSPYDWQYISSNASFLFNLFSRICSSIKFTTATKPGESLVLNTHRWA